MKLCSILVVWFLIMFHGYKAEQISNSSKSDSSRVLSRKLRQSISTQLRIGPFQAAPILRSLTNLRDGIHGMNSRLTPVLGRGWTRFSDRLRDGVANADWIKTFGRLPLATISEEQSREDDLTDISDSDKLMLDEHATSGESEQEDEFDSGLDRSLESSHEPTETDHEPVTLAREEDAARGLGSSLLGSALYTIGKLTLGQETADRLTPVVQGIQQLSNTLPVVEFKDGRIVLGEALRPTTTTSSPDKSGVVPSSSNSIEVSAHPSSTGVSSAQNNQPLRSCTTFNGGVGRCRDLSSCPILLLDFANLRKSICFQSLFVPGVCCPESGQGNPVASFINRLTSTTTTTTTFRPRITTTTPLPLPAAPPPPITQRPIQTNVAFPDPIVSSVTSSPPVFSRPSISSPSRPSFSSLFRPQTASAKCGQVLTPSYRVVGGDLSRPGAWPWMSAIYLHGPNGVEFWCGGSLINEQYVMTAAHCTQDGKQKRFTASQYTVRLGEYNLKGSDPGETEEFRVTEIKVHPQFSGYGFYNDLALFKLERPVRFTEYVQPVCLPSESERSTTYVGKVPTIIGWGTTYYGGRESTLLREVDLPVWRNEDCDRAYFQPITEVFLCAGYADGGKDACQGDSGGPLLLNEGGSWTQIGIVSFGNKCAEPGFPGVYTRITHFLDWIKTNAI